MVGIKIDRNLLKKIRKEKSLTQAELESLCGFSKNYIYWLENGKGNPSEENLDKLLSVLNITIDELCNTNYTEDTKWEGLDDPEIFSKPFGKDLASCIKRVGMLYTYFVRDVLRISNIASKEMLEEKWCGPLSTFARVYKKVYTEDYPDVDFKILDSYIRAKSGNRFMRSIVKYCFINNISVNQFRVKYGMIGHDILFWNNKNEVPGYKLYAKICDTLGDEFTKYLYSSKHTEGVNESHIYYRFNDVFKEFRSSHKYSLMYLTEIYCVSINTVSRWERGYSLPSADKLEVIMNDIDKPYNSNAVKFGILLNLCRERLNYDRSKLGESIGVSEYIIYSFERGIYPPTREHFEILADTLELNLTYSWKCKCFRRLKGFTLDQVSKQLNVLRSDIIGVESGVVSVSPELKREYGNLLYSSIEGVTYGDLWNYYGKLFYSDDFEWKSKKSEINDDFVNNEPVGKYVYYNSECPSDFEFCSVLKSAMLRSNMPCKELACQLSVSQPLIYSWLEGRMLPKITVLKRLQEILDINKGDMDLSCLIGSCRIITEMPRKELAKRLNINKSILYCWTHGLVLPDIDAFNKLKYLFSKVLTSDNWVLFYILKKDLSINDVANILHVDFFTVKLWCEGKTTLPEKKWQKLIEMLGHSKDEFNPEKLWDEVTLRLYGGNI